MNKTVDQLARIARNGGGFRISARQVTADQLARILRNASEHNSRIEITDSDVLSADQMARIARNGQGSAFFT